MEPVEKNFEVNTSKIKRFKISRDLFFIVFVLYGVVSITMWYCLHSSILKRFHITQNAQDLIIIVISFSTVFLFICNFVLFNILARKVYQKAIFRMFLYFISLLFGILGLVVVIPLGAKLLLDSRKIPDL
ncbi:MAG: hypothetical protein B6D53_02390 [Candidatus Omnitrophica bacterium 4484_49]|nr:MAG: hypothetical protein B6D53_02390 [Candidatus Omnitrophica bacterium 4484_49]